MPMLTGVEAIKEIQAFINIQNEKTAKAINSQSASKSD
jgi:hypothetical protein